VSCFEANPAGHRRARWLGPGRKDGPATGWVRSAGCAWIPTRRTAGRKTGFHVPSMVLRHNLPSLALAREKNQF
jgi:hypothetical protein